MAESCALAEKKKGSFGRKHIDCMYEYTDSAGSTPKALEQGPIRPKAGAGAAKSKALARSKEGGTPGSAAGWFSKLFHGRRLQVAGRRPRVAGRSLQQEYPAGVRRVGDAARTDRKRERQQLKSNEHVAEEVALLGRVARERCAKRRHGGRTCHDCTLYVLPTLLHDGGCGGTDASGFASGRSYIHSGCTRSSTHRGATCYGRP